MHAPSMEGASFNQTSAPTSTRASTILVGDHRGVAGIAYSSISAGHYLLFIYCWKQAMQIVTSRLHAAAFPGHHSPGTGRQLCATTAPNQVNEMAWLRAWCDGRGGSVSGTKGVFTAFISLHGYRNCCPICPGQASTGGGKGGVHLRGMPADWPTRRPWSGRVTLASARRERRKLPPPSLAFAKGG